MPFPQSPTDKERQQEQFVWAQHVIAQAQEKQFYGKLVLNIENGFITRIINEQTLLPPKKREF